jgi:hypothetical protein
LQTLSGALAAAGEREGREGDQEAEEGAIELSRASHCSVEAIDPLRFHQQFLASSF